MSTAAPEMANTRSSEGTFEEGVLDNGIRVLTEHLPGIRSAAVGIWIRHGSANERDASMGVSHLLEHMVFKGTESRSAKDIALSLESLGGSLDAYTSREHTGFQARVLDEHLPIAIEVLADLVLHPRLYESDLRLELEVVLEKIAMVDDTPDDLVFELHGRQFWGDHPYGFPILGTTESVRGLDTTALMDLHRNSYVGCNIIFAAVGNVDHQNVMELARRFLGEAPRGEVGPEVIAPGPRSGGQANAERPSSQSHVVFGTRTVPHSHPSRYTLAVLSAAFGGGMSSRLFQRVREERGLAYSVHSFQSFYHQAGQFGVYLGTRPETVDGAVDLILSEFAELAANGLSKEEVAQARQQVKGQVILSMESTASRLHRLAGFALSDEPFRTLSEVLARLDAVTDDGIRAAAREFLAPDDQFIFRLGPSQE